MNFVFFLIECLTILILLGNNPGEFINIENLSSPLYISVFFADVGWIGCFVFQALFVFRGLPFFSTTVHYKNCLMLKIKFHFVGLCVVSTFMFSMLIGVTRQTTKSIADSFFLIMSFVLFKCKFSIFNLMCVSLDLLIVQQGQIQR